MCLGCYEREGSPRVVNEKTVAAADAVGKVYEYSSVGGNAHIVLDDWNLDDHNIRWCLDVAIAENSEGDSDEKLAVEREALERLLALTYEERVSALAIYEELLAVPAR